MGTFIVNVRLKVRPYQHHLLMKAFRYARIIQNRLIALERRKLEIFDGLQAVRDLRAGSMGARGKARRNALSSHRKECGLTRFDIIKDVKEFYKPYRSLITSQMAQSIAKRVDAALTRYVEGDSAGLDYIREVHSIESESTDNGIKFDGSNVIYGGMSLPLLFRKDSYFNEARKTCELKYIRIVQRIGKTRSYYVAQMVFSGDPVSKGKIRLGEGDVGIDMGTSTIAYSSQSEVRIEELSRDLVRTGEEMSRIDMMLDSSRRANNPGNYNDDGTCKRKEERSPWWNSRNYLRLRRRKIYLGNKLSNQRKDLYERQVNHLLSLGDRFIIEPMDYRGLQRRARETSRDEKGRFRRKGRYGKSICVHAPGMFVGILSRKLGYLGLSLLEVDIRTFRASQYDHVSDEYIRCDLDTRIKHIGGHEVQRDLYSAFLLMNADDDLRTVDREKCIGRFPRFLSLHSLESERLRSQDNISCIGY